MKSIIIQLWHGNIKPLEEAETHNSELKNLKNLKNLINRNFSELSSALDEKQRDILGKYKDCIDEYLLYFGEYSFSQGFSSGMKIMQESLRD